MGAVCPQCGSTSAVHSIEELAALARARLGQQPGPSAPAAQPQLGWAAEPQAGPLPGPGGQPGSYRRPSYSSGDSGTFDTGSVTDDLAGAVLGAATGAAAKFIGRAISRRMQDRLNQQVVPAMAAKQEEMLRTQIAIAERHPDLCACLNDQVVFLTGGSRALPLPNLTTVTVEQADALVARLRDG